MQSFSFNFMNISPHSRAPEHNELECHLHEEIARRRKCDLNIVKTAQTAKQELTLLKSADAITQHVFTLKKEETFQFTFSKAVHYFTEYHPLLIHLGPAKLLLFSTARIFLVRLSIGFEKLPACENNVCVFAFAL